MKLKTLFEGKSNVSDVYDKIKNRYSDEFNNLYGSTRYDGCGYVAGFTSFPNIEQFEIEFPDIEFRVNPDPKLFTSNIDGIHDVDEWIDEIAIQFRIRGNKGWWPRSSRW